MSAYLLPLLAVAATLVSAQSVPQTGKTYTISPSAHPNLCVVPNGDYNGARLAIQDCDSTEDIAWVFDGQSLKNTGTEKCVDVLDGGHWNGNGLQQWDCFDHNTNQRFSSRSGGIQWLDTGMCLDLTDGKDTAGTYLQLWQCFDGNTNQQWTFDEVDEVEDCEDTPESTTSAAPASSMAVPTVSASASASASSSVPSASASASAGDDEDCEEGDDEESEECDVEETATATSAAAVQTNSTIGGGLWAGAPNGTANATSTMIASATASNATSWETASASSSAPSWESASASSAPSWESASASSVAWGESASASASASTSSAAPLPSAAPPSNGDMSGYLQTQGARVVDPSGKTVQLIGTNLGGWLVWEDWMCGITDNSGTHDRFPQSTLERRFGEDQTRDLMKVWQDNWLVESDFDKLAAFGFNVLRLPFSYRNFQRSDGSLITDGNGNLDLSRLDWAIAQAKKRGMYVIPTYHIWEGQEEKYSTISEDTWEGKQQRDKTGALWTKIAAHYQGETAIAAFDAINEPTGSANNNLQRDLYHAIRAGDSKRIIIMESISAAPDGDWTNVMYSMHEYLMMGENDDGYNQWQFEQGPRKDINHFTSLNVPSYIGEFMASGNTLSWMLDQLNWQNDRSVWYSGWSYKSVNRDRWALYNFGSDMYVDVSADSFDTIRSKWSNMGGITKSRIADQWAAAAGGSAPNWKRDEKPTIEPVASPRVRGESRMRRSAPHGGRSRRALEFAHGLKL